MRRRYLDRSRKVAHVTQILASIALSLEERKAIAEYLESDFLLNPPVFVE